MYRVTVNSEVLGGIYCIEQTRVPVSFILAALAEGFSKEEVLTYYGELCQDDIVAALLCGAELAARPQPRK